ncbi:MAG: ferredoxin--NADP reductase [Lysobacteraceae bacterium]|nr:MAG: ferredoxin--NADP reductase [Xanthomonadaceae bacterium]
MSNTPIETDALIIGAGPVGLFQVFELGLLDIKAHLIDSMQQVGGQCAELYPDKPIYDIPALPVCGAQELVDRLMEQIKPFDPTFHLGQEAVNLVRNIDGTFHIRTSTGTQFNAKTVIIAGGVGSFRSRPIRVQGADRFEGEQIHYAVRDPSVFAGKDLVILGGGDSALDWTLQLIESANSVVLVHRSTDFRAAPASVKRMQALCDDFEMQFVEGNVIKLFEDNDRLAGVGVHGPDGITRRVDLDHLLVFFGLSPKLGPIADWGLELQKKQLTVDTEKFQTSVPGIFAVGDINTYPGKKKLILSGFHETALAAFAVQSHINPEKKVQLQYTTTSPAMHRKLGVA